MGSEVAVAPEAVTPLPPRDAGRTVLTQDWRELTFLHWPVAPARLAAWMPPGVRPDVLDGCTWLGLVPFRMDRVGLLGGPALPYVGSFCETNVRAYTVDRLGRRGVVFLTLEASRLAPVLAGRVGFRLPYTWARMGLRRDGDVVRYASRRLWPRNPGPLPAPRCRVDVRVGEPVRAGDWEHFLTARWGLHVAGRPGTRYQPNEHGVWPLHRAELVRLDGDLLSSLGFADLAATPPVSVLYSPGVHVRFGPALPV